MSCPFLKISFASVYAGFAGYAQAGGLDNIWAWRSYGGESKPDGAGHTDFEGEGP